jgi:hypothetical protein
MSGTCWPLLASGNQAPVAAPSERASRRDVVPPACAPFPYRDEAPRRPDFVAFRRTLMSAVKRRDVDAVVAIAAPDICLSFGGSVGQDELRRLLAESPEHWEILHTLLSLGGGWEGPDSFTAPYVSASWPQEHDSFEERAIVGSRVRVRAEPRLDAAVLVLLTECIVQVVQTAESREGWVPIGLGSKRIGYVSDRHIRSPIDYRAGFEFKERRWRMTSFLAGD